MPYAADTLLFLGFCATAVTPLGRKALGTKLKQMGFELPAEQLNEVFKRFKGLADKKKVGAGLILVLIARRFRI